MNIQQSTNLVAVVEQSLENTPHLWKLEHDQLINDKHSIIVNDQYIKITSDNGQIFTQKIRGLFFSKFNYFRTQYNNYVVDCNKQKNKDFFPLDLYYAILENINEHVTDWAINSNQLYMHNRKLNVEIYITQTSQRHNYSTINDLKITDMQAVKLLMAFDNAHKIVQLDIERKQTQNHIDQTTQLRTKLNTYH